MNERTTTRWAIEIEITPGNWSALYDKFPTLHHAETAANDLDRAGQYPGHGIRVVKMEVVERRETVKLMRFSSTEPKTTCPRCQKALYADGAHSCLTSSEERQAQAERHPLWPAFIEWTIRNGYDGEPTMDDSVDRMLFAAFVNSYNNSK